MGKGARLRRKRRENRPTQLPWWAVASTLVSAFLGGGLTLWLLKHFVPGAFHPESYNRSPATFIAAVGGAATALLALWFWSWWLGRKDNSSQQ